MARTLIEVYLHIVFSTKHRANIIHPEIEAELHRSIAGIIASTVSPTTRGIFGTEDATAPRSVRYGRWFRGSREGSLHSPARDPRLFHRPLRGRGINAPQSRD